MVKIDTDPYCPNIEPIVYQDKEVPIVDKYIYLET